MFIKLTKPFLIGLFSVATVAADAQTYSLTETVNSYGDTILLHKDQYSKEIKSVKKTTDIFGNTTIRTTNPDGKEIQFVKKSTDIFGNKIKR
jgi:hypothetical protein